MSTTPTKSCLLTGCNTGIGLPTAHGLLQRGYKVFLTTRSDEKTRETIAKLGNHRNAIAAPSMDLANIAAVQGFVTKFKEPVSLLVCNAGIMGLPALTHNSLGMEMQVGVNHVAHQVLVTGLLSNLQNTAKSTKMKSRVIMVSSDAHRWASKDEFSMQDAFFPSKDAYNPQVAYARSKLFNVWYAGELNRRYGDWLEAFSLHPGVVSTELARHMPGYKKDVVVKETPFGPALSPEDGAKTTFCCIDLPQLSIGTKSSHPAVRYFSDCKEVTKLSSKAKDEGGAKSLWEFTNTMVSSSRSKM